jgi:hypothetical protein
VTAASHFFLNTIRAPPVVAGTTVETFMRKAFAAVTLATLGFAGPAFAQQGEGFSYNLLELGYVNSEIDDADADGDGFGVRGSFAFAENFHGFASYLDQEFDFDIGVEQFELGAGLNYTLTPALDFVGTFSYLNVDVDFPGGGSADDSGFALGGGLRGRVSDLLELRGEIKYAELDDGGDDTTLNVGARYYLNRMFALAGDIGFNDDGTSLTLGVRVDFK